MAVGDLLVDHEVCVRIRGRGKGEMYRWQQGDQDYSGKLLWEVLPGVFLMREIGTLDFWLVSESKLEKWSDECLF